MAAGDGPGGLGYSSLLDLIAPDPAVRRDLLAGYFEAASPGRTHELLADFAAAGTIRVFVTTNFDRLLERALLVRGIEPVVVSDDATLGAAPRREHSSVFIVKAHGDYLQETIRNSPSELVALEPALTAELQAIANNYGVVVLGWSGSDPALAEVLRRRQSRYGVWWLSLTDPPAEPGRSLAKAIGARIIVRTGAAEFLADLSGRLAVYAAHESGHDPGTVHDEILALVRRRDDIGLDEALRRERNAFEVAVEEITADHIQHHLDEATVRDAWGRLDTASDRRLGSLLPIALHRPDLLDGELRSRSMGDSDAASRREHDLAGGLADALLDDRDDAWRSARTARALRRGQSHPRYKLDEPLPTTRTVRGSSGRDLRCGRDRVWPGSASEKALVLSSVDLARARSAREGLARGSISGLATP